jgi:hypothetical protein
LSYVQYNLPFTPDGTTEEGTMPRKRNKNADKSVPARRQLSPKDSESMDDEANVDYGKIPNDFCLQGPREDWQVTKESLKRSPIVPQISNNKILKDHLDIGTACNPHLMNRFGLVSW